MTINLPFNETMGQHLISIAAILTFLGCNKPVARDRPSAPVRQVQQASSMADTEKPVDFAQLLKEIENCNEKEITYFDQHWNGIHSRLKQAADNRRFERLPVAQQEELWNALAYLSSCRHGDIMREHGADMVAILLCFGTDEQLSLLREIYPNEARDAK